MKKKNASNKSDYQMNVGNSNRENLHEMPAAISQQVAQFVYVFIFNNSLMLSSYNIL